MLSNGEYKIPLPIEKLKINIQEKDNKKLYFYKQYYKNIDSVIKKYPDIDYMIPYDASVNLKTHINKIDKEYIDYIENIDQDLVSAISYYRMTNINLLADVNGKKQSISSSSINMSALPKNLGKNTYIKDNYDLLAGKFSENKNEVVLVLDSKNRIDTTLLDALGIDSKVKKVSY